MRLSLVLVALFIIGCGQVPVRDEALVLRSTTPPPGYVEVLRDCESVMRGEASKKNLTLEMCEALWQIQ